MNGYQPIAPEEIPNPPKTGSKINKYENNKTFLLIHNFDEAIQNVIECYSTMVEERNYFQKKYSDYHKDEEIKKLEEENKSLSSHSLHIFTDKELELEESFRKEHFVKCANAGSFNYELEYTGIGTAINIVCPKCGQKLDLTEYGSW